MYYIICENATQPLLLCGALPRCHICTLPPASGMPVPGSDEDIFLPMRRNEYLCRQDDTGFALPNQHIINTKERMETENTQGYAQLLHRQREYFMTQTTKAVAFREAQLKLLMEMLKGHERQLCEAMEADFHKSAFDTFATETGMLYGEIKWQLRHLRRNARPRHVACNLLNLPARFRLLNEPLGNVLIIGAWNYPLHLALLPAVDAMAAGCTCIVKPSELAPHTSHVLSSMVSRIFPPEYLYVAEGGVEETTALLSLPFNKIFFTGSPQVGRIVYEAAARNMVPVTLELGGKSPVIVTRHADLPTAAKRIAWGKCLNAGQTCVAPDYLLADSAIKKPLLALLQQEMSAPHYHRDSDCIPHIINRKHYERLSALTDGCQGTEARVLRCGTNDDGQLYFAPTLIDNASWESPVMREEIFGPILPVLSFNDLESTLSDLARREHPLSAYLFSQDRQEQRLFAQCLSFGGGCINDVVMHLSNPNAPFGGVGNSGTGHYHGREGFLCFSHQKSLMTKPVHGELPVKYPPYTEKKLRLVKKVM